MKHVIVCSVLLLWRITFAEMTLAPSAWFPICDYQTRQLWGVRGLRQIGNEYVFYYTPQFSSPKDLSEKRWSARVDKSSNIVTVSGTDMLFGESIYGAVGIALSMTQSSLDNGGCIVRSSSIISRCYDKVKQVKPFAKLGETETVEMVVEQLKQLGPEAQRQGIEVCVEVPTLLIVNTVYRDGRGWWIGFTAGVRK